MEKNLDIEPKVNQSRTKKDWWKTGPFEWPVQQNFSLTLCPSQEWRKDREKNVGVGVERLAAW